MPMLPAHALCSNEQLTRVQLTWGRQGLCRSRRGWREGSGGRWRRRASLPPLLQLLIVVEGVLLSQLGSCTLLGVGKVVSLLRVQYVTV